MNTIDQSTLINTMRQMAAAVNNDSPVQAASGKSNTDFQSLVTGLIDSVNESQQYSSKLKQSYELGEDNVSLTQVMIASQKSEISFQALLQVRNKLLSAYQEVMRIQI